MSHVVLPAPAAQDAPGLLWTTGPDLGHGLRLPSWCSATGWLVVLALMLVVMPPVREVVGGWPAARVTLALWLLVAGGVALAPGCWVALVGQGATITWFRAVSRRDDEPRVERDLRYPLY